MPEIVGIKFAGNGKSYYFDPKGLQFEQGDGAIVETVRGLEYGTVAIANAEVDDGEIKGTLKPVVRKATDKDRAHAEENVELAQKALDICAAKIAKHGLKMKLVGAEYTFDRNKVIFSFTADGRVDFRELVKDVASVMHTRIELRQIYERDDIRMRGAMGMCGRPCCCIQFLDDFEKVTVKMAKNQNLSLNPTKVSGMCGKLMCCLKYEKRILRRDAQAHAQARSARQDRGRGRQSGRHRRAQTPYPSRNRERGRRDKGVLRHRRL